MKIRLAASLVGERLVGRHHAKADGFFADARQVQAGAVIAEVDRNVVAFLAQDGR
jgi:hypothetical protein